MADRGVVEWNQHDGHTADDFAEAFSTEPGLCDRFVEAQAASLNSAGSRWCGGDDTEQETGAGTGSGPARSTVRDWWKRSERRGALRVLQDHSVSPSDGMTQ
jgi:hypothetical protein